MLDAQHTAKHCQLASGASLRPTPVRPPAQASVSLTMQVPPRIFWRSRGVEILNEIALKYEVPAASMLTTSRKELVVTPRAEAMDRMSRELKWSTSRIGQFFKRDGSTVRHQLLKFRNPEAAQ